ncbi:MAG: YqaJ viral recombinase family protein [Alphaproteobacteria bacterium]|nr:YqaJ viral recombinase family protein [Alphaproteobacteria bacterium]
MITDKQRSERINYIGSTDAPGILGMSRYSSPLKVWCEKTGVLAPEDIGDRLNVRIGTKMEQIVAELYEEETGKKLRKVNETIYYKKYPFIACNLDRYIVGEETILEIKTASEYKKMEWDDEEIPQEYIIQVYHQMAVTGKKAEICCLIGNSSLKIKQIPYDEKLLQMVTDKEVEFWNKYVIPKIQPEILIENDSEILKNLYPTALNKTALNLPDEINVQIKRIEECVRTIKMLESEIEINKNNVKNILKDSESGVTNEYSVSWKNSKWAGIDQKKLRSEFPEIYEQIKTEKEIRKFSYKKLGE